MESFRTRIAPRKEDRLLDVGGTPEYWRAHDKIAQITLLNRFSAGPAGASEFEQVDGDGCALPFQDGAFDIVFSNSVIEHVGTWSRQQAFAKEVRRVGRRLWIQTPAREFFIEPHLIAPLIHWLPVRAQRHLIRHWTLWGWLERPSRRQIEAFLDEVRLITYGEMQALFPDCFILRERILGITKSYVAVRAAQSTASI